MCTDSVKTTICPHPSLRLHHVSLSLFKQCCWLELRSEYGSPYIPSLGHQCIIDYDTMNFLQASYFLYLKFSLTFYFMVFQLILYA